MQIPVDTITAYIDERVLQVAMQNVQDKKREHFDTVYDRGRYAAYRELLNWITTNYSND